MTPADPRAERIKRLAEAMCNDQEWMVRPFPCDQCLNNAAISLKWIAADAERHRG